MEIDLTRAEWLNEPRYSRVARDSVEILTDPKTDFWQRSYYGFRNDNGHALLLESAANFSLTVRVRFQYRTRFDQCGLLIYLDADNWVKASIEHEDRTAARLGSVVTNRGYSDWATTDIAPTGEIRYRLSRRGPDFLIESSLDGRIFRQMRVLHLHALGETTAAMGQADPPLVPEKSVRFGPYACSPGEAGFSAFFDEFLLEESGWRSHFG